MTKKIPPRQLILEAVVACIEKYGLDKLTTRKIAEEAGTNIASINYYFRSKDELVAEVMDMTVNHMMEDVFAAVDNREQSFENVLREVFFYLIDGAMRFPGVSTAHLHGAVVDKQYDSPGGRAFIRVFEKMVTRSVSEYPQKDKGEVRFLLAQVYSALMFTMLTPGFFPIPEKFQPLDEARCRELAERYAALFLAAL
jgi:AcrR family transcriptional regulator